MNFHTSLDQYINIFSDKNWSFNSNIPSNAWDLSELPGILDWLTVRTASSVLHTTSTATADQTVSQWNSINGAYNYTMNDNDPSRPILKTNVQGGLPVVRFTASTMMRGNSAVSNATKNIPGLTIFIAGGWSDFNAGTDINLFMQEFINSYNNQRTIFFASKSSTSQAFAYVGAKNTDGSPSVNGQVNSVEYISPGFAVWTLVFDFAHAKVSLRRNGVYVIPDGTAIPGMTPGNTPNTAVLETDISQNATTNSEGSNFDLSEMIRCNQALDLNTIILAETQLSQLYSVDFHKNPVLVNPAAFTMTFNDEFLSSSVDTTKWIFTFEDGRDTTPTNNELEVYKSSQATISGGILDLKCIKQNTVAYTGGTLPYRSGLICSFSKFTQKYGYFEARVKTPPGKGVWPAFWLLNQSPYHEIDIFEQFGEADRIYGTVYYHDSVTNTYPYRNGYFRNGINITADYHKFAVDWTSNYIRWYFDDYMYSEVTDPAFIPDIALYLLLNLAIDGNNPPDSNTVFPANYLIDYVRVYQRI